LMNPLESSLLGLILPALLAASLAPLPDLREGDYVVYRYTILLGDREVDGVFREEVVRAPANGSVRLRMELTFNDGVATLEKDFPEDFFIIPRLPQLGEGRFTYTGRNSSVALNVAISGSTTVTVSGRVYLANIYNVEFLVSRYGGETEQFETRLTGTLTLINGSGVIYRAEVEVASDGAPGGRISLELLDSSIDLTPLTAPSSTPSPSWVINNYIQGYVDAGSGGSSWTDIPSMISGGLVTVMRQAINPPAQQTHQGVSDEHYWRAVAVVSLGVAVLAVAAAAPTLVRRRGAVLEGVERKPHHV